VIKERDNEIRGIQAQIGQVNDLFKGLQKLVFEQSDIVDNIQVGISNVSGDVTAAKAELTEAEKQQTGQRNRNCIIAIIVTVVAVVVVAGVVLFITLRPKQ
jgi:t-SNARE complex subunit (syntaxin)